MLEHPVGIVSKVLEQVFFIGNKENSFRQVVQVSTWVEILQLSMLIKVQPPAPSSKLPSAQLSFVQVVPEYPATQEEQSFVFAV